MSETKFYAIIENEEVVNVVIAENIEDVKNSVDHEVVECIDGIPGIGWKREDGEWISNIPPSPWHWNGEEWVLEVPYPEDDKEYTWDEETHSWILIS